MSEPIANAATYSLHAPTSGPLITADLPGIGGTIKQRNEDFKVEEVPLYPLSGQGTHVFFLVEKSGLDTQRAARILAKELGCRLNDLGYAGLKDAHAITRQWFSVEHADPERIARFQSGQMRVLEVTRHTNKIKVGHLAGNRFIIRIRDYDKRQVLQRARAIGEVLTRRGVPNYFGPQRFGARGDTHRLGKALLLNQADVATRILLGKPGPADTGKIRHARELFEAGQLEKALEAWPHPFATERIVLKRVIEKGGRPGSALRAIRDQQRTFFLSAYQSALFNAVLAARIQRGWFDRVLNGDLAEKHANGAVFRVEDADAEQARCEAHEISPTGPLFGYRASVADGEPGELERAVLESEGLTAESWRVQGRHKVPGDRRAVRFVPKDLSFAEAVDADGPYIECRFFLPKGSYATCLLAEVCKSDRPAKGEAGGAGAESGRSAAAEQAELEAQGDDEAGADLAADHPLSGTGLGRSPDED